MAKVVGLKIEIDGFPVVLKNLKDVDRLVGNLDKSLKDLNKSMKGVSNFKPPKSTPSNRPSNRPRPEKPEPLLDDNGNIKQTAKNLGEVKKQLKEIRKETDNTDFGTEKFRKLQTQQASLKNVQKSLRDDVRKTARELEFKNVDSSSLRGQELQYTRLRNEIKLLSAEERNTKFGRNLIKQAARTRLGIKKLKDEMNDFTTNVGNYKSAFGGLGGSFKNLALTFGVGLGLSELTRAATEGIKTFASFDQQVAVLTGVLKSSKKDVTPLREEIIRLGSETQFTAQQTAEAATNLARAGLSQQEIIGSLDATLKGAISTGEDLESVADVVAKGIRGLGLEASDSGKFVDILTETLNTSNNRLENYREALKVIAPVSNTLGISAEETSAAIGLLGDSGLQGTDATTSLSSALIRLSDDSQKYAKVAEDLGVKVFDQNGEFVGLSQLLKNVEDATAGATDQQRQQTIAQIFGVRAVKQFSALLNAQKEVLVDGEKQVLSGADALAGYTKQLEQSTGAADEAAGIIGDTLQQDFLKLQSAVEGATIKLVEGSNDGLRLFTQEVTKMVPEIIGSLKPILTLAEVTGSLFLSFNELGKSLGLVGEDVDGTAQSFSLFSVVVNTLIRPIILFVDATRNQIELLRKGIEVVRDYTSGLDTTSGALGFIKDAVVFATKPIVRLFEIIDRNTNILDRAAQGVLTLGNILTGQNRTMEENIGFFDFANNKQLTFSQRLAASAKASVEATVKERERAAQIRNTLKDTEDLSDSTERLSQAAKTGLALYESEISRLNNELKSADVSEYERLAEELAFNEGKAKELREELERVQNTIKARDRDPLVELAPIQGGSLPDSIQPSTEGNNPADELLDEAGFRSQLEQRKQATSEFLQLSRLEQLESERQILNEKLLNSSIEFEERLRLADELARKELEITRATEEAKREERRISSEQLQSVFNGLQEGLSVVSEIDSAIVDNRLAKVDERYDREIERAEGNEERITEIEKKRDAEKRKIEKAAFERNKAFSIAQAAIQGALAIQNIAATVPKFDFGVSSAIQTAFVIGQTIAQIATISAQKFKGERGLSFTADQLQAFAVSDYSDIPKAANGGTVTLGGFAKGKRHSQGGINTSFYGVPVEIEDGEFVDVLEDGGIAVINRRSSKAFRNEFESMGGKVFPGKRQLYSRLNQKHGGVRFAEGGVIGGNNIAGIGRESLRRQGINFEVNVNTNRLEDRIGSAVDKSLGGFNELPQRIANTIDDKLSDVVFEIQAENNRNENEF